MDLKGIIAISGKPGLFKVAAQGRNNIIVESLDSGKKFPAFATDKISALEDISIYTYETDVPLAEIYEKIAEENDFSAAISHKESSEKLREALTTVLPDFDEDRVYDSDIKKLYQWYNILIDKKIISKEAAEAAKSESAEDSDEGSNEEE